MVGVNQVAVGHQGSRYRYIITCDSQEVGS